jgi:hypothetical protein
MRPWRPVNDTVAYNQGNMIDALAQMIINRRLEAAPGPAAASWRRRSARKSTTARSTRPS